MARRERRRRTRRDLRLSAAGALAALWLTPVPAAAQSIGDAGSDPLQTAALLAALGLAPLVLVVVTSFAKFAVVFGILRSALGTQQVPPNVVIASLALMLTGFVMAPTLDATLDAAAPWLDGDAAVASAGDALHAGRTVSEPLRAFLAANAGTDELRFFSELRGDVLDDPATAPLAIAAPAFAITELSEAFQIGFLLFLPFLVLDLLVGSVLLSLGMHMLAPASVSMPFKLLLFVLVNGWLLLSESLVLGYVQPGAS